jgi:hypothetical protein
VYVHTCHQRTMRTTHPSTVNCTRQERHGSRHCIDAQHTCILSSTQTSPHNPWDVVLHSAAHPASSPSTCSPTHPVPTPILFPVFQLSLPLATHFMPPHPVLQFRYVRCCAHTCDAAQKVRQCRNRPTRAPVPYSKPDPSEFPPDQARALKLQRSGLVRAKLRFQARQYAVCGQSQ